jgi:benzoyl-CoA reductase subunit C
LKQQVPETASWCEELHRDLTFDVVRKWKAADARRRVVGFLPVYTPREIIHAAGALPMAVFGGGDELEIIRGDSFFQSYICHLPRSTIELGVSGRLDFLDGMIFPSTCDVIRNLSGMWKVLFPGLMVRYLDLPQNLNMSYAVSFYAEDLRNLARQVASLTGVDPDPERLRESLALYNENRRAVRELYDLRAAKPWIVPTRELYLLLRAGGLLPVEQHTELVRRYMEEATRLDRKPLDNTRIVLVGTFCEQPPLGLLTTLERAGCYIVDDDLTLGLRWLQSDVPTEGDPFENLARAYFEDSPQAPMKYQPEAKGEELVRKVRERRADGVIFCAASFCDPALLEQPMLQRRLEEEGIPYTSFKYAENTGQFQNIREQAGTFADSVKLWGAA